MVKKHQVVVDGSNLATEGRTRPSLAQLDEAVQAYAVEDPQAEIVVVVDASFGHRIDPSERGRYEQAELDGDLVSPPAGAIGRGDAFVLRIAERTGGTVLSNDSFQEFHEEHPWLFESGRLVGGKPVPGVGWIFTPRLPVRGARSRKSGEKDAEASPEVSSADLPAPAKAAEVAKALQKADRSHKKAGTKRTATKKVSVSAAAQKAAPAKAAKKAAKKVNEKATARTGALKGSTKKQAPKKQAPKKQAAKKGGAKASAADTTSARSTAGERRVSEPVVLHPELSGTRRSASSGRVRRAIDQATVEVLAFPDASRPSVARGKSAARGKGKEKGQKSEAAPKRRRYGTPPPPAVNEPLAFITFVASFPLGSTVGGRVVSFTSHGAMVDVDLADSSVLHCYVPLAGLGDPPPRKAREVLSRGEQRTFVLVSLDPPRRMAELALPDRASAVLAR